MKPRHREPLNSPTPLRLLLLPGRVAGKAGRGPDGRLGPGRQERMQDQALPEVAWVALATGASKNLPRDFPGQQQAGLISCNPAA